MSREAPFGPCVRLRGRSLPHSAFAEYLVDVKDAKAPSGWRTVHTEQDTDDQAPARAVEAARAVRRKLLEGETP